MATLIISLTDEDEALVTVEPMVNSLRLSATVLGPELALFFCLLRMAIKCFRTSLQTTFEHHLMPCFALSVMSSSQSSLAHLVNSLRLPA
jgi:hypothetical protein